MPDDTAAWRGRIIADRYEVDDVLGRGGMGVVLRAHHKFTGATAAIKVLRKELANDPELQRRFQGEARASNTIGHPGIVQIFDAGRDAQGELYLAMELLEGESLRLPILRGQLRAPDVRRIGLELLAALGAAHAHQFVHRDLKPENVFLVAPNGVVKLLDFGIAKVIKAKPSTVGATAAGVLLGTVAYMAPEQLEDARAVDPRADLWAVGVMLYELLAGRLPFDAYTPQSLFVAVATLEPISIRVPMPAAPDAVVEFFKRALARDPAKRFGSAEEMARALEALPLGAVPTAPGHPAPAAESVLASGFAAPAAGGAAGAAAAAAAAPPRVRAATPVPKPTASRGPLMIGAAAVVAIAGVAIAYVATRPTTTATATATAQKAAQLDAAAVAAVVVPPTKQTPTETPTPTLTPTPTPAPVIDAAVVVAVAPTPTVDAAVAVTVHSPTPTPTPEPKTVAVASSACAAACTIVAGCNVLANRAQCERDCADNPGFATCVSSVDSHQCPAITNCMYQAQCGGVPHGSQTCGGALACVQACRTDRACTCKCNLELTGGNAWYATKIEVCSASCVGHEDCMNRECPGWQACK